VFQGSRIRTEVFSGTNNFTVSFYFKPLNTTQANTQTILYKRNNCSNDNAFAVRYSPTVGSVNVILSQSAQLSATVSASVDPNRCWHHVVVVRENRTTSLWLDGILAASSVAPSPINITNDELPLIVGKSSCNITDGFYEGFLDELLLYNRALSAREIEEQLFIRPDQIGNAYLGPSIPKDTIIYLGQSLQAFVTPSSQCTENFFWSPADGLSATNIPNTIMAPEVSTTYFLAFQDAFGCTALDSFFIRVIDPATLECQALLPTAFTPNGDGLNDTFGLDNPFGLTDFISLEIIDRWGNVVFFTNDPFVRWDGTFRGTNINPASFLWIARYRCDGQEFAEKGKVTLLK
jgi:gliding motility-associated-like protein